MKESYSEDLSSHAGLESCVGPGEGVCEALDRGVCRPSIEPRELTDLEALTQCNSAEGNTIGGAMAMLSMGFPRSETSRMHRNFSRETREVPCPPRASRGRDPRCGGGGGKALGQGEPDAANHAPDSGPEPHATWATPRVAQGRRDGRR